MRSNYARTASRCETVRPSSRSSRLGHEVTSVRLGAIFARSSLKCINDSPGRYGGKLRIRFGLRIVLRGLYGVEEPLRIHRKEVKQSSIHRAIVVILADLAVNDGLRLVGRSSKLHDAEHRFLDAARSVLR